jgi:hypothetical protein
LLKRHQREKEIAVRLVKEIRDGLANSTANLSGLLRKAKILSLSLGNAEFKAWTTNELNGYSSDEELPPYRVIPSQPVGYFAGPFGSTVENMVLPISHMPDSLRELCRNFKLGQCIRELEVMATQTELRWTWPTELVLLLRDTITLSGGYVLVEVSQPITKAAIEGVLDAVRNRLLDFILSLQDIRPSILESEDELASIPKESVAQSFSITILGDRNILATGAGISQTVTTSVNPRDPDSLITYLKTIGFEHSDLRELRTALDEDGERPHGQYGIRVKEWIGNAVVKAATGALKVAASSLPTLLTKAISSYYGWD